LIQKCTRYCPAFYFKKTDFKKVPPLPPEVGKISLMKLSYRYSRGEGKISGCYLRVISKNDAGLVFFRKQEL
jgi:hypothetical protein